MQRDSSPLWASAAGRRRPTRSFLSCGRDEGLERVGFDSGAKGAAVQLAMALLFLCLVSRGLEGTRSSRIRGHRMPGTGSAEVDLSHSPSSSRRRTSGRADGGSGRSSGKRDPIGEWRFDQRRLPRARGARGACRAEQPGWNWGRDGRGGGKGTKAMPGRSSQRARALSRARSPRDEGRRYTWGVCVKSATDPRPSPSPHRALFLKKE